MPGDTPSGKAPRSGAAIVQAKNTIYFLGNL